MKAKTAVRHTDPAMSREDTVGVVTESHSISAKGVHMRQTSKLDTTYF